MVDVSVDVLRADTVLLQLTGTTALERDERHLLAGDKLFFDLRITAAQKKNKETEYYDDYELLKVYTYIHLYTFILFQT